MNVMDKGEIKEIIRNRLSQFDKLGKDGVAFFDFNPFINIKLKATLTKELAFCISVANSSAISGLKFEASIEEDKLNNMQLLEKRMKFAGVRFHKNKAKYVYEAQKIKDVIIKKLRSKHTKEIREWLVKNVKGLGYKEASHFLRNIGHKNVAIIDRHILSWLYDNNYLEEIPKNINKKTYFELEKMIFELAHEKNMHVAELDLWLWYEKTGKVLK